MIELTTASPAILSGIRQALNVPNKIDGTFSNSVSAPSLSGTFYGDGSNLTGINTYTGLSGNWNTAYNTATDYQSVSSGFVTAYNTATDYQSVSGSFAKNVNGTFSVSVSAPSLSGAFYGDGSRLTGVVKVQTHRYGTGTSSIQPVSGNNSASGCYSVVAGGIINNACGIIASIGGGCCNTAGFHAVVGGGWANNATGNSSTVGGGWGNTASGYDSTISGGTRSNATANMATVGGGYSNNATGTSTVVAGGQNNTASGCSSNVAGGSANIASGNCSAILGGYNNNTNNQGYSYIVGHDITASQPNFTYVNNLSSLGAVAATSLSGTFYGDGSNLIGASLPGQSNINTTVTNTSGHWNTAYNTATDYQGVSSTYATNTTVKNVSSLLTPTTVTNTLTGLLTPTTVTNTLTGLLTPTTVTKTLTSLLAPLTLTNILTSKLDTNINNLANNLNNNFFALTGGTVSGFTVFGSSTQIFGNLTINGSLSTTGTQVFSNTTFSTTSSLSVVNLGQGPALFIEQNPGPLGLYDIASFRTTANGGKEVLHIGSVNPITGIGRVGINDSDPNFELTVNGSISATADFQTNGQVIAYNATLANPTINSANAPAENVLPLDVIGFSQQSVFSQFQNLHTGISASTDISLYNDLNNYLDIGINSSQYNGNIYYPEFNITQANDVYAYSANSGNFAIGTAATGDLILFTGGALSGVNAQGGNERLRIKNSGNIGINVSNPTQPLTVSGNISSDNVIYDKVGNSNQWNNASNTATDYQSISGTWLRASNTATDYRAVSGNWNTAYNTATDYQSVSGTWLRASNTATDYRAVSGNWNTAYNTSTDYQSVSGNWNNVFTYVNTTSATNNPSYNVSTFAKLSSQAYTLSGDSILPVLGSNTISGQYSTIAGGICNSMYQIDNFSPPANCSTISGGRLNKVNTFGATIAGGVGNIVCANAYNSTIGGGEFNCATSVNSVIGGGQCNTASGNYSTVSGGYKNTASGYGSVVAGGGCHYYDGNKASGKLSNVSGGIFNIASGDYSSILGGQRNDTKEFANTFILGSSLSASQPNYTYVNNLSSQGLIASSGGNSNQWNNASNTATDYQSISGTWLRASNTATDYRAISGNWNTAYNTSTDYRAVSGNLTNTVTDYQSVSGTWLRASNTATDYRAVSGTWQRASNTATDYRAVSGNWQKAYNISTDYQSVSSTAVFSNNSTINNIVQLTQVQYNALGTYSLNTIYVIVG